MLSSFKKSPVEQETIGCYSIFQVGSLSNYPENGIGCRLNFSRELRLSEKDMAHTAEAVRELRCHGQACFGSG